MAIRNKEIPLSDADARYRRKADQHWEMAGLARQDGDMVDAERHTAEARRYEQLWRESR
jgi:hypothetical protein